MSNDLISREALLELYADTEDIKFDAYNVPIPVVRQNIKDMPAVDAVEVVRCSKCKYGEVDDPDSPEQYLCHYTGGNWNMGDHYCSYGEPKMET